MLEMLDKKSLIINATRKRMNDPKDEKNAIKNQLSFLVEKNKQTNDTCDGS